MTAARGSERAGLGRRFLSLIYESLLLTAVVLVGMLPIVFVTASLDASLRRSLYQAFVVVLAGVYFVWQWTHGGQTLAMKTWRLKLVTRDGAPFTVARAFGRFVAALLGSGLLGAGFLWAFFDPERQFLHDRLAGTRIVNVEEARS